jgi:DNA invertase Pin-like site-specific DNA recombinase
MLRKCGMKDFRPQLNYLIEFARKGDILVVYKTDRLGRSTKKISNFPSN